MLQANVASNSLNSYPDVATFLVIMNGVFIKINGSKAFNMGRKCSRDRAGSKLMLSTLINLAPRGSGYCMFEQIKTKLSLCRDMPASLEELLG